MQETTLCYIEKDGQYLMLNRNKKAKDINAGKWIGVGGKLKSGESVEECLLREVKEETGLTLTSYAYRGRILFDSDAVGQELMHVFTADGFVGELGICDEGELAWVLKENIFSLPMWEGDREMFKRLEKDDFFEMTLIYAGDAFLGARPGIKISPRL